MSEKIEKLKQYWNRSIPIAKRYHIPTLFIFIDRIWCKLRYNIALRYEYEYYGLYRLNHLERKNFYTEGKSERTVRWFFNPEMIAAIDSKKGFAKNFSEFLNRDILLLPCKSDELSDFVNLHGFVFVKEEYSNGGKGVHKYSRDEILNNQTLFSDILNMDGVVEEAVVQHPEMISLNESAVSTIRISTLVEKNGDIKLLGSILRVGKTGSFVDNASSGGYIYQVDINEGVVVGYGKDYHQNTTLKSPTGVIMPGFKIPFWKEAIDLVYRAASKYPDARFIGWDVAIGTDGPLLIEANASTGPSLIQFGDYGCWKYLCSQR